MNLTVITDALAAYRLTRLITEDTITEPLRERVYAAHGDPSDPSNQLTLSYLVSCPHCTGIYAAAFTTAARLLFPRAWTPVATALAIAAAISIYAENRE